MPSTYTLNGGIEKIATGEQSGTWGATTNTNFDIIDRITNGVGTIDLSLSGATHTLTTTDGTLSDGMFRVLVLDGATTACTITIDPNTADKLYFVNNASGQRCTFTQGSGTNVTFGNGEFGMIYADGGGASANVVEITKLVTTEGYNTVTSSSGTAVLNLDQATVFQLTLSENITTFTWSNPPASGTAYGFSLKVIQDSSARTISWPASVDWPGGTAPTLSTGSGEVDVFTFFTTDGGTTYYGFSAGKDLS